jgi:post-segregation antitoxin (ccd killing protein)
MNMGMVKASITISDDLYSEAKRESANFSALVSDALKEYFRMRKVKRALGSFGAWEERTEGSQKIVDDIRNGRGRTHARRHR